MPIGHGIKVNEGAKCFYILDIHISMLYGTNYLYVSKAPPYSNIFTVS